VLTFLYPGATVALARVVVKERPSVHQIVGLSLALAGVASIAAGRGRVPPGPWPVGPGRRLSSTQ
jgi:drug/metabolite transporter (DMT)-like permease